MPIRILEDHVVNQIAAGEVVERPASVVKELVENAIDAGARTIRVTLRQGGCAAIHVADDGCGMSRDDALMATERHATSKIRSATDLESVATFGFRGEALPSIAAVSRFALLTRTPDAEVGTRVRIEGGRLLGVTDAGCAPGTEIEVRSLFFNLPARRKFLRARATELGHCLEAVVREALPRPGIDFLVHHDGREVLRAPAAPDRAERARELLGSWGRSLRPVRFEEGGYAVEALVSPVGVHKSTPAGAMYLYVDGRYVRDPVLRRAVNEAYADLVPKGRYPVVVLDLSVPSGRVDVNVHPSKVEVRFHDPRHVGHLVATRLREALRASGIERPRPMGPRLPEEDPRAPLLPLAGAVAARPAPREAVAPPPLPAHPDDDPRLRPTVTSARELGAAEPSLLAEPQEPADPLPTADPPPDVSGAAAPEAAPAPPEPPAGRATVPRILGQMGRYLLFEQGDDLLVLDRRAARRTHLLRELRTDPEAALGPSRRLLAPALVALTRAEVAALERHAALLEALRVDLTVFGPGEVALRALPTRLSRADPRALVAELAGALAAGGTAAREAALVVIARHAGADEEELDESLALTLLDDPFPAEPAFGRVVVRFGADELARRFEG